MEPKQIEEALGLVHPGFFVVEYEVSGKFKDRFAALLISSPASLRMTYQSAYGSICLHFSPPLLCCILPEGECDLPLEFMSQGNRWKSITRISQDKYNLLLSLYSEDKPNLPCSSTT